jgi:pimeloyl-ACP methyl ester carboxylesterase
VLRIDYDGSGDSAGDQWDTDRVAAWRATVTMAVEQLRRMGARQITLVGAGLGGTFALLDARSLGADRVVAWAPVVSGRRYARELRLLSTPVPEDSDPLHPPGTIVFAGNVFSAQTLDDVARLAISDLTEPPAREVLVVDDRAGAARKAIDHLRSIGSDAAHLQVDEAEPTLETAPEFAVVPEQVVAGICEWLGDAGPSSAEPPALTRAAMTWDGVEIAEEVLSVGEHQHVGVLTSPLHGDDSAATLVFLNPGSETHVGPGRAWVEYARSLAVLGHRSVRIDFRGWGESPDAARAPGRPYDAGCEQDTVEIVRSLEAAGYGPLALFGLCASAWIGLRAVLHAPVAGLIAMNPQMYWKPGDHVDIDWDRIRARRAGEIRRVERGSRLHAWTLLDLLGHRSRVGNWLDELAGTGVPIELLFAEGDDGIVYLSQRVGRRLARAQREGKVRVRQLPGIDHPMHLTWLRPRVVEALHEGLQWIDAAGRP